MRPTRSLILAALCAAATTATAGAAQAQMIKKAVEADFYLGFYSFASRGGFAEGETVQLENLRDNGTLGGRFGVHFTEWLGVQGTLGFTSTSTFDTFRRAYYVNAHVDAILSLPFPYVVPYMSIGAGFQHYNIREEFTQGVGAVGEAPVRDPYYNLDVNGKWREQDQPYQYRSFDGDFLIDVGAGAKFLLHERVGPMVDFRWLISAGPATPDDGVPTLESPPGWRGTFHHLELTAGVFVLLGGGRGPDKDKDGIANRDDGCPEIPEDRDGFQDEDGCPDPDNDQDDIPDEEDDCPTQPEDRDGFADDDGCPDLDNDGDDVEDEYDRCPTKPEDYDGFNDDDGCPDPDNDGDGFLDDEDACRGAAENFNFYLDEDDCPDDIPAELRDFAGVIPAIQFHQGSARLKRTALPLLNEAAQVLGRYPELIVEINGHASSEGDPDFNMALSQDRVETVRDYLIDRGLSPDQLVARGFGETQPVADNSTEEGRARNRRVEFRLTK